MIITVENVLFNLFKIVLSCKKVGRLQTIVTNIVKQIWIIGYSICFEGSSTSSTSEIDVLLQIEFQET